MTKIQYGIILDTLDIAGKWFQIKEPGLDAINNIYYDNKHYYRFDRQGNVSMTVLCQQDFTRTLSITVRGLLEDLIIGKIHISYCSYTNDKFPVVRGSYVKFDE